MVREKPRGIRLVDTCSMAGIASDLVIRTERASLGKFFSRTRMKAYFDS